MVCQKLDMTLEIKYVFQKSKLENIFFYKTS